MARTRKIQIKEKVITTKDLVELATFLNKEVDKLRKKKEEEAKKELRRVENNDLNQAEKKEYKERKINEIRTTIEIAADDGTEYSEDDLSSIMKESFYKDFLVETMTIRIYDSPLPGIRRESLPPLIFDTGESKM